MPLGDTNCFPSASLGKRPRPANPNVSDLMVSRSRQILLVVGSRTVWRSFLPVANQLIQRGADVRILAHSWAPRDILDGLKGPGANRRNLLISPQEAQQQSWRYIVISQPLEDLQLRGHKVYISHGMMFGNAAWTAALANSADTFICRSSAEFDYLDQVLGEDAQRMARFNFGSPRMDRFSHFLALPVNQQRLRKKKIRERFGFRGDRPTLMVTSHYSANSNLKTFGAALLETIVAAFPNAQIIATCHLGFFGRNQRDRYLQNQQTQHAQPAPTSFDFDAFKVGLDALKKSGRFVFLPKADPFTPLLISDIAVCDFSSILLEAAILDIPILHRSSAFCFHPSMSKVVQGCGPLFSDLDDLLDGISAYLYARNQNRPDDHHQGRAALAKHFFTDTGRCVADICDLLLHD